ncbi:MAG: DUF4388 domain-containing protein [Acidobacteria bacterium]|nr:DUF4388 domain-containing protein [Acidobacteriota bacterium]MBI3488774.1 DUF4388 domain-containing protein [Acidobacteriota bacterium]
MSQGVIQGSMREAPLPDIIQLVSQGGKSGCFHVQQEASRARIYLKDGRIIHAVTHAGEGFEALMEVALWLDGTYRFEEEAADVQATITKPNASILMELGRRMDEWRVISQKVPSVELYPASTLLPGDTPHGVNPREAKLLALATGYYTVAELAEVLQKPVLSVAKDLYGLVMAGHLVMKGIRSGRAPKVEAPPEAPPAKEPAKELVPASAMFAASGPVAPQFPEEETAIVRLQAPPPMPQMHGFPENEEPLPETVGGGVAGGVPLTPPLAPPLPPPVQATAPKPAPVDDPQRMVKLMNFTQRIAQAAKMVLPEAQHEMVNRLQAKATQQIISGDGPEAVKGLALAISRGAVDAGCDADMVRTLNTHLKALFSTK